MNELSRIHALASEIREQGYEAICFWLPAYNTGGGTYYFCEMAKYLTEGFPFKIYYMDYQGGYPSRLLKGSKVELLEYRDEDLFFPVKEKCIIVTNSTRAIQLKKMRSDNKLLFWHYETVPCAWDKVFIMDEGKSFLELCREKKAMMFHDWSGWDILSQDCGKEYEKQYLPLFLPTKEGSASSDLIHPDELNVVWLGRFGHEKIYSLFNLIQNLSYYETEKKIKLHMIGDGIKRAEVEQYCQKYIGRMSFIMPGIIPKKDLDNYLLKYADIVFGMGLSVLEGAALKIPSVIVKLDNKPIEGNEFIWLYNSKEYCAGILPSQRERFDVVYNDIWEILDCLNIFDEKALCGQKCYEHYMENESSFENVMLHFFSALVNDRMTMADLEACILYIPYNHIRVRRKILFGKTVEQKVLCF